MKKPKARTKAKVVAAGGDDSDSDSSLDVEKWKKLVLQMTGRCLCVKKVIEGNIFVQVYKG